MMPRTLAASTTARARRCRRPAVLAGLLAPSMGAIMLLFGGGLGLGLLQSLGHLPSAGLSSLSLEYFIRVLADPDFFKSLGLTLYVALTSTAIAAIISVLAALAFDSLARRSRILQFVFQVPLTVPHLVIAVAAMFLLAPTGLVSRAALHLGLIESSSGFPLLVNDAWGLGIMAAYIWKEIPFITLMVLAVLRASGSELLDVGRTLKADRWQRFRHITLPTIFPSLGAACLIVFAYTVGAYEVPFLMGPTYPMMLPVWAYRNYSDIDLLSRPEGIAAGLVIAAVVALSVVFSQFLTRLARRRGAPL